MHCFVPLRTCVLGFSLALGTATPSLAQQSYPPQPHRDDYGDATFALAGDAIITRKLSVYSEPEFLELRDLIHSASAAFVNAEMLFLDYQELDIIPAAQSGGTYMRAEPELADELAWMGFDLVSTANNHSLDFSFGGLRSNLRWLRESGLVASGTGENLAEARAPKYMETPHGRVALISASSSFVDFNRAGPQRKDFRGRPGLNPLRVETTYVVPTDRFRQLQELRSGLDLGGGRGDDEMRVFGSTFQRGDEYRVVTVPNEEDLAAIAASVADAKRQANWVIVSSHTHQGGGGVADFLREFAHTVIDAGADVFVGHGPHVLRGVEIYKGKPIFYSLGDFLMQNETVELQPWENYNSVGLGPEALPGEFYVARNEQSNGSFPARPGAWEAVVAVPVFHSGVLERVELHPITLGYGLGVPQRGRPLLAKGELAERIIRGIAELSEPLGARVTLEGGIGVIRP